MRPLAAALQDAGGLLAGAEHAARLRGLLLSELAHGAAELERPRSGYAAPVRVAFTVAAPSSSLLALAPVAAGARTDPDAPPARAWALVAAVVDALVAAGGRPGEPERLDVRGGEVGGWLLLGLETRAGGDPELAVLAFDEAVAGIDRLRAEGVPVPGHVLAGEAVELRAPVGAAHPLRRAEAIARRGGRPADPASAAAHAAAVAALLGEAQGAARPHDDPDPARRVARRILQTLVSMGKWGGYHTEFAHLPRGFAGHERALAGRVGEALITAGLLGEKPSTGQRHVFLNPRRAADIRRLVEDGRAPGDLVLPDP